ncbi:hypothetical protein BU16DRAFT_339753 [Lophium mytilinum]|uniref:Chitin-binding type-1 domain-containing protein n=1 Tax=Lophium mytilinum TaxID=390894 RepID=A0A6A6QWA0_9PEZI|nr:hypothetical protein BU16DRAFT_339753 [Lophium mytilinum]
MLFIRLLLCAGVLGTAATSLVGRKGDQHRCGLAFGNKTCDAIFGRCCSSYGFCGKSDQHCLIDNGCQSGCIVIGTFSGLQSQYLHSTPTVTNATILLPWSWTVKPETEYAAKHPCPSVANILVTFAAINVISGALSTVFGHRLVVKKITFGLFGKRGGRSYIYMWIMPFAFQLGANALVANMIQRTTGYGHDFTIAQLMFFFAARPRVSWILVMLLSGISKRKLAKGQAEQDDQPLLDRSSSEFNAIPLDDVKDVSYSNVESLVEDHDSEHRQAQQRAEPVYEDDYYWRNAALSQYFAELALQAITLYYMSKTVVFAYKRGYYDPGSLPGPMGHSARIMYAGALFWLCAQLFVYLSAPTFVFILVKEGGGTMMVSKLMQMLGSVLVVTSWLASWLFWAGFVRLAGDLYCPPKLVEQGAIWSAFSSLGMIAGVGI